ncbi:hypothetical protein BDEG_21320 [Batrachochytrium dendrobatidis JEL423]|uniref:Uncharacterized protein n=1 Tax=Batrachochytrium dendrobatidis (strain JEL423) TaxID=403673 RepID=A0A177WAZ5_BATDL|nr:hypothetical protein BDEG_21320 [Batrachochytrium dendrobatidis JEL423]
MVQDDDSLSNQLCKLIQIEVDPISHIEHLYVESRFTPKNGAAATDTHAEGSKILAMKSSHIGAQSNTNTVDIVIDDENDDQFLPFSTAVAPKQNDSRKRQRVRNLFKYPNMKSEELANRKEICQELASNNLESLKSPSQFHALFFVGCFTGQGLIAEISWSIDVKTKKIEFEFSIICQKKLSQVPILFSKFQQMEDGLSIITTETVSASGDHFLQSFTLDLKLEWMCKCDVLILVAIDHANRTVSQNQYFKADHAVENLKAYEKMMITAICEDRYHKGLILALRNGSCVRVTYTRNLGHNPTSFSTAQTIPVPLTNQKIKKLNHFDAKTDKQTHGLNFTAANTDRLLKISWCVELFQKADEEMPYRNKNIHIVEDGTPTYIVGQTSERIGLSFINNPTLGSKPDDFEVISLKCIINLQNKKPQLIITGSDGLVRIFANNIEKILTRPLSVICFDKSVRSVDDTDGLTKVSYHAQPSIAHTDIITTRDTQLFTAFTNKCTIQLLNQSMLVI